MDSVTQLGQNTVSKVKTFGKVTKLKGDISANEAKIEKLCTAIGRLYEEIHRDEYEKVFESEMTQIRELRRQIEEMKTQIATLQNVVNCPVCGASVDAGAAFCISCGAKIPQKVAGRVCSSCGNIISSDAKFCTSCGQKVEPKAAQTSEDVAPNAEIRCKKCDSLIKPGTLFCANCGEKV